MANNVELMSPMRLTTYRNDKDNNQVFQWVIGEYESEQLAKWENILDGSASIIQDTTTVDPIKSMFFRVTKNTTEGDAILTIDVDGAPTLSHGGECVRGGSLETFTITEDIFNRNSFSVYKNGSRLQPNIWVKFVDENQLQFTNRLQVGDIILIEFLDLEGI